ncbi:MAG: flagellar FlbD family protein [Ilumatobacteraceae bacterium]
MIRLTRIRHSEPLYLNPDRVERIEEHADTVVRMENGNEYVVSESAAEIVALITDQRARVLALSYELASGALRAHPGDDDPDRDPQDDEDETTCPPH